MSSKMRMVYPYPGKRYPQNVNEVTFKKSKELKLRDFVRDKTGNKQTPCLFEMSLVFTCLKENNFNEKLCMEEVEKFNNCYMKYNVEQNDIRQRKKNKTPSHHTDKLLDFEVNRLLQMYKGN